MSATTIFSSGLKTAGALLIGFGLVAMGGCGGSRPAAAKPAPAETPAKPMESKSASAKDHRVLKDTPFDRSWDLQLPKPVLKSWISENIPELIFFQLRESHEIYAVDAFSGNTRWVTQPFEKSARLLPFASRVKERNAKGEAIASDDRLWVISDDTLYSFDAVFGQVVWRFQLTFSPSTGALAVGPDGNQRIFIGDWDGRMQVVTYHAAKHFPYALWQKNLGNPVTAGLVEQEGLVYAADQAGTVHCFKQDRDEVWSYKTGSPIYGAPLTRGRALFVGNDDNVLYALNRLTGERLGALYLNGPIKRAPFAYKSEPSRVYLWVNDSDKNGKEGGLYAIKTQNDNIPFADNAKHPLEVERVGLDWFVPKVSRLVGSTPDYLFVTEDNSSVVLAVNRGSGKIDWTWDVNEEHKTYRDEHGRSDPRQVAYVTQYQDSNDLNRSVYTIDGTGHVIAYRVYGDKPGDPLTGDRVVKAAPAKPAADKSADDKKAADKPAADKPAAAKPAPAKPQ